MLIMATSCDHWLHTEWHVSLTPNFFNMTLFFPQMKPELLKSNNWFPVCSSGAGSEWAEPSASVKAGGWAGGWAEVGTGSRPPGQHPVDGSTQEETHDRDQSHPEKSWQQAAQSSGAIIRATLGSSQSLSFFLYKIIYLFCIIYNIYFHIDKNK